MTLDLEIEQARFGDRLQVAWQRDPRSEALPVPQLILQPLVENALRHGLSRRARPGSLTISSRVHDEPMMAMACRAVRLRRAMASGSPTSAVATAPS